MAGEYTQGPWEVGPSDGEYFAYVRCVGFGGVTICNGITNDSNAPLIAAAPNLLEACKMALQDQEDFGGLHVVTKHALRCAIAAAEPKPEEAQA